MFLRKILEFFEFFYFLLSVNLIFKCFWPAAGKLFTVWAHKNLLTGTLEGTQSVTEGKNIQIKYHDMLVPETVNISIKEIMPM